MKKKLVLILTVTLLCLTCIITVLAIPSRTVDERYIAPGYLIDFNDKSNVAAVYDVFYCAARHSSEQQAMQIIFEDNQNGYCFDPYLSLPLPAGAVDVGKYHYMSLLIKTDFTGRGGQMRLRSATTAEQYPFFNFKYQDTDDWQLVIIDLTDLSAVGAFPPGAKISGTLTNLRLDMFDNFCDPGVNYYIKAYGLYENRADAETFVYFESEVSNEPVKPDIDYSAFWRGEHFFDPANAHRMNWVSYGFNSTYKAQVNTLLD